MSGDFKAEIGEFKGSKTIALSTKDDKRVLTFGLTKAKAILACLDEIKEFVAKNDKALQSDLNTEEV
jgi:hypothetical protein